MPTAPLAADAGDRTVGIGVREGVTGDAHRGTNRAAMPHAISTQSLSIAEARRIALAAQGLAGSRRRPARRTAIEATIARLGLLQIDSVNVLVRAHYLPLWSRLGAYERAQLDALAAHGTALPRPSRRRLFEYWAHEASLVPVELQPLLRWRMARARDGERVWKGVAAIGREQPALVERVLEQVRERGPITASELAEAAPRRGGWWGWDHAKTALEWLFWTGEVTAAGRRGFERLYDLPERVLPHGVLAAPTPAEPDAIRALVARAAVALGIAAAGDLRDYWRLPPGPCRRAIDDLVEAGELLPVAVEGWRVPAFLHRCARMPRRGTARTLVAPFDPLVWERDRTQRLFGFRYRIEIYTPAPRREHGYYVLPFLMGERLRARVDLKADRAGGALRVLAAHLEPAERSGPVAEALLAELRALALWLGLSQVVIAPAGDLAPALRAAAGGEDVAAGD
jgi:uncharacterized protein YcaQ